jgi:outer membrane protein TolC
MVLVIRSAELRKARTDLDSQRRKLVVLKAQQEAGQATAGAVSGLDFAIAEGELAVDRLQFAFEGAVKRFARVCGLESFDPTALPEGIPAVDTSDPVETEPLRGGFVQGEGLENRVPYANLELQLRREELALRQVRSELRPKLNFQVEANQEQLKFSGDAANRNVKSFFTGVQVQWNIFDGFATRGRARASKLRIRKLEERLATVREDLATEAGAAAKEVEFAGRALGFAERRFRSSTGSLTELRKRRAEDRATEIEVLDAEQGERTAQLNAFKARADYLNSIVIFLSIVDADPMVNTFGRNVRRP